MIKKIALSKYKKFESLIVDLPRGISCISAPNGGGKSTICSAIIQGLFGKQRGTAPLNENTEISLELSLYDKLYNIRRLGKMVFLNDEPSSIERVQQVFKPYFYNDNVFKTLFVVEQGTLPISVVLNSVKARDIFSSLFGFQILDDIIEKLREFKSVGTTFQALSVEREKILKDSDQLKSVQEISLPLEKLYEVKYLQELLTEQSQDNTKELQHITRAITEVESTLQRLRVISSLLKQVVSLSSKTCPICESETLDLIKISQRLKESEEKIQFLEVQYSALVKQRPRTLPINAEEVAQRLGEYKALDVTAIIQQKERFETLIRQSTQYDNELKELQKNLCKYELYNFLTKFYDFAVSYYLKLFVSFASQYLTEYTDFKDLVYTNDCFYVGNVPISQLSWGERTTVLTTMHLALSQLFCECYLQQYPFLVFDSAFDFVDDSHAVSIINMLSNSPFQQIILTTHNPKIPQDLGIPIITLEK